MRSQRPLVFMDGLLVVDKPVGWTSHDVVAMVRGRTGVRKVGHAGSLDPLATGVLLILLGRATKLADRWLVVDKEYVTTIALGTATDSGDAGGAVIATRPVPPSLSRERVAEVLRAFTGSLLQTPPMVSALKHRGRPLYWWARRGQTVERAARPIQIHALELLALDGARLTLRIVCSKGTYIRTLAEEIAAALETAGHLANLQRTRVGPYTLAQAVSVEWLRSADPLSLRPHLLPLALPPPQLEGPAPSIDRAAA